jgi:phosphatidylglycerophosphate synthase
MTPSPLPPYAYRCEDRSILLDFYKRTMVPLWRWWVPRWLPANMITLGSSACMWVVLGLSFNATAFSPETLAVAMMALTQAFLAYDHVDGMQAKATGTSSALGEYLDHSLDVYHGAIMPIATCALLGGVPTWLVLALVWCSLVSFAATMVEEKERGELFFGWFGTVEAMFLFQLFFLSWLFPAMRSWWVAPLFGSVPAYAILVAAGGIGCLGTMIDCLRRIGRVPIEFTCFVGLSLLLSVALVRTEQPLWCVVAVLLAYGGDYIGRVIGTYLLRRPHVWPDFVTPLAALVALVGPAWIFFLLLGWLGLRTAGGIFNVVYPLRGDWRWTNPPAKPA